MTAAGIEEFESTIAALKSALGQAAGLAARLAHCPTFGCCDPKASDEADGAVPRWRTMASPDWSADPSDEVP